MNKKERNLEFEQSFMRLLLVLSGEIYSVFLASTGRIEGGLTNIVVLCGGVYIFFSLAVILQVYLYPFGSKFRHTIYMALDVFLVC
ncbi:MAG TPA: hypothetical protein VLB10_02220, partial [Gammaproteobacteria bacterium]|nr:hypothetical protein [Gammaproteobacteria bacterium]